MLSPFEENQLISKQQSPLAAEWSILRTIAPGGDVRRTGINLSSPDTKLDTCSDEVCKERLVVAGYWLRI